MDDDEIALMEYIEGSFLNVVIDYPDAALPRIRIFAYESVDNGVHIPQLIHTLPDDTTEGPSGFSSCIFFDLPHLTHAATEPVSKMVIGVESAADTVIEWAVEYEKRLGAELSPSPLDLAANVARASIAQLCAKAGVAIREINVSFQRQEPEEEYRPGIYL